MKKIVNGVTYNTDTSTELAISHYDNKAYGDDPAEHGSVTLYQTRGGAFYLVDEGEKEIWNAREREHEQRAHCNFRPLSAAEAEEWLMRGQVEIIHNPFGEVPEAVAEAEPGATLYVRLPTSLKTRIEEAARAENLSANVWAMRCMERCLGAASA
jgi:hypothetical protein